MIASECPNCGASVPEYEESCAHCGSFLQHEEIEEKVNMVEIKSNNGNFHRSNVIVRGSNNDIHGDNIIIYGHNNEVYGENVLMHGSNNDHHFRKSAAKKSKPKVKIRPRPVAKNSGAAKLTPLGKMAVGCTFGILIIVTIAIIKAIIWIIFV